MKNQASFLSGANFNFRAAFVLCCAVLLLLGASSSLQAQITTAALRGSVTDEQGAAIAGAEVAITNIDTGFTRTVTSGGDGEYNFPDLPLGTYRIHATHSGFKSAEQTGITLHVNDRSRNSRSMAVTLCSLSLWFRALPPVKASARRPKV
jgi:hypothetical protein